MGGEPRVAIVPGSGVVARIGTGVLVAPGSPTPEQLAPLLEVLRAGVGDAAPGRALARGVAAHLFHADPASVVPFGVVGPTEQGWALLLHGAVEAVVRREGAQEHLSGTDAATWVDRVIADGFASLHVGAAGQPTDVPTGPFELESGVVPGGGIVIVTAGAADAGAPAPAPLEVPQPGGDGAFQSILLIPPVQVEHRPALGVIGDEAGDGTDQEPETPLVDGILCEREHFNHPQALYCSACGVSTVHRTRTLVKGPRPPLGVLVVDDGSVFSLGTDYLVGREPDQDDAVRRGHLRPLRLLDAERSVSRVHAEIRLRDWDVVVVDRSSANGTFVAERGETTWRRLSAGQPEVVQPGTRVAFGKRFMTFDTHHPA